MSTDPQQVPEPEVRPSSTPDGPQTIPAPTTPEGEPGPSAPTRDEEFDNRGSNPNSTGPHGLSGDMGVSSERTGPASREGRPVGGGSGGIEGTGSRGTAVQRTDGEFDSRPTEWDAVDVSQRDTMPLEDDPSRTSHESTHMGIDRTVGEPLPDPIPDEKLRRDPDEVRRTTT
jgi:hypothetical protein